MGSDMGHLNNEKGIALVLVGVFMLVLLGLAGLAIDLAYVYFVKNHLQVAADAAALAGAEVLYDQNDIVQLAARAEADKFAGKNKVILEVETIPAKLNALSESNDISVGYWDGGSFTAGVTPANAVRVRARRTEDSPGGPVNLFFARTVGWQSMRVSADAIAVRKVGSPAPIAVNEYWYGDNPTMFTKDNPGRLYPNSYFRPYNVDGTVSTNWEFGTDPFGSNHGKPLCLAGENANPNNSTQDPGGYVAMDFRVDSYLDDPEETWFMDSDFQFGGYDVSSYKFSKGDWAPYLDHYSHRLPICISEKPLPVAKYPPVFEETVGGGGPGGGKNKPVQEQSQNNIVKCPYDLPPPKNATSPSPYATMAYLPGVSVGLTISEMIDNGNYRNGKYTPGKNVIMLVYDGLRQGTGNEKRVTIIGYAKVKIIGYGNSMDDALADPTDKTGNSVYGYAVEPMVECFTHDECLDLLEQWAPRTGVLVR